MDLFARCFLLVFAQLYVGGMLALAVPPFHGIERGFYKSTAGVYLGFGLAALIGRLALLTRPPAGAAPTSALEWVELGLWLVSLSAAAIYLAALWGEAFARRARAFTTAWLSGVIALAVSAQSFRLGPSLSLEAILYPLSFLTSALLLGAVTTGMLLGHWYLIDHELSIDPFRHMLRFFITMLIIQSAIVVLGGALLMLAGSSSSSASMMHLLTDHRALLLVRLLLSPVTAAMLAWMIWKTLQIPQTMAATGLFYIAILSVLVGEMMSRFILFRTSLPM